MNGYTQIYVEKAELLHHRPGQSKWKSFLDDLQSSWHTFDASGVSWFKEIEDLSLIKFVKWKSWPLSQRIYILDALN